METELNGERERSKKGEREIERERERERDVGKGIAPKAAENSCLEKKIFFENFENLSFKDPRASNSARNPFKKTYCIMQLDRLETHG